MFVRSVTGQCLFKEKCMQVDKNVQEITSGHVTQHHNSVRDFQSPIYEHYLCVRHRCGITVTNAWYFNMLWNKLWSPVCTEQRWWLSQAGLLLHLQCTPSYFHPSNTELEHSQQPSLQSRLDDFRFSSGWTHTGRQWEVEDSQIMTRWMQGISDLTNN